MIIYHDAQFIIWGQKRLRCVKPYGHPKTPETTERLEPPLRIVKPWDMSKRFWEIASRGIGSLGLFIPWAFIPWAFVSGGSPTFWRFEPCNTAKAES